MLRCRIPGKADPPQPPAAPRGGHPALIPSFWRIPGNCRLQNHPGQGWAGLELVWEGIFWEFLAFPSSPSRGRGRDELHGFLRSPRPDFWEHPGPGWIRALAARPFPFQPQRAGMRPGSRSGNENPGLGMRSCSWVVPPGNSRFSGERGRLRRQSWTAPRGNWLRAGIAPSGGLRVPLLSRGDPLGCSRGPEGQRSQSHGIPWSQESRRERLPEHTEPGQEKRRSLGFPGWDPGFPWPHPWSRAVPEPPGLVWQEQLQELSGAPGTCPAPSRPGTTAGMSRGSCAGSGSMAGSRSRERGWAGGRSVPNNPRDPSRAKGGEEAPGFIPPDPMFRPDPGKQRRHSGALSRA